MLSHDQMAFAVTKLYPDLVHSRDFWVAHPVATGSAEQIGEAEILAWQPKDLPPPSRKALLDAFKAYADEFSAQRARESRDARLLASDWTQMPDIPHATRERWATYRQALRDLPQQMDFPEQIVWPELPADNFAG